MKLPTRRDAVWFIGGAATVAAGGIGARLLLRKRFAPTPYDDLIALVADRDAAAQIGETLLAELGGTDPVTLAAGLRKHMAGRTLAAVATEDAAQGRLVVAAGWVMPESLGLICALAAKASG